MTSGPDSPGVAIIGIACRFPGATDHRIYWRNLCDGVESIARLSDRELVAAGVSAELLRDPAYVKAAPILPDIELFDAAFFEYSPKEASFMDPQQRLLLEVAWETFEDAGHAPGSSSDPVGVFVGSGGVVSSYLVNRLAFSAELPGDTGSLAHMANDKDFPSTRISYKLNLTGPSVNVQTACSTSIVAVHLACQAILSGECDMALAGAATVRVPQQVGYLSVKGGILSPDGHCRAFDAQAQGTVFGSGVGMVLLKDLAAAVADGDNIYAVIRGSAINNDGADKVSYTASSVAGQARAMVEAMSVAKISPADVGYVECHGTGTIVGDPLEVDALTRAFRTGTDACGFCAIGSVKTNIGHLEQTAGVAALIKAALALKDATIPASLHFRQPNPKIDFAATPFFVNTERREWPASDHPRFAAVNSLGLGGTNAFVVLEEPPSQPDAHAPHVPPVHLFALSAKTEGALRASLERHRVWLESVPDAQLADICFTLTSGRCHFAERFAAAVSSTAQLRNALAERIELPRAIGPAPVSGQRQLAFLFSGQGSQFAGMGAELYKYQPVFRAFVDRCAKQLRGRLERPLAEILLGASDAAALINETAYTQPALFVIQAALVELWRSWGVDPDVVLGHSVGEFAAAYCAGAYTLEEALELITERGRLMQGLPHGGAMASVFADEAAVARAIQRQSFENLAIAAVNAPQSTVISGPGDAVAGMTARFEERGVRCQRLTVSHAFHSPLMRPVMEEFGRRAAALPGRPPKIAWVSTVFGSVMTRPPDAQYWCEHALRPVRFADGMQRLADTGATDFIEIGPGNTLLALGRQCLGGDQQRWLGSLRKGHGGLSELLTSLGQLYQRGYKIDWDGFNRPFHRHRVSLPAYSFERRRFWIDDDRIPRSPPLSPDAERSLTGVRVRSALPDVQFESAYGLQQFAYLDDHRIYGMPVLPLTAGLTALSGAARQHFAGEAVAIANLQYREAMVLPDKGERVVQSILSPVDEATAEFRLASIAADSSDAWHTHMIGMVRVDSSASGHDAAPLQLDRVKLRCSAPVAIERYYAALRTSGLEYGPSFRGIESLWRGNDEALTRVRLPDHLSAERSDLHPALLDACLHVYPALIDAYGNFDEAPQELRRTYLPIGVERFRSNGSGAREVWVHAARRRHEKHDPETVTIDIAIHRDDGSWAAAIEGLSLKPLAPEALRPQTVQAKQDWLYQMRWDERPPLAVLPDNSRKADSWLILADHGGVGEALARLLEQRGGKCRILHPDDLIDRRRPRSRRGADDLSKRLTALMLEFGTQHSLRGVINLSALDVAGQDLTFEQHEHAQERIVGGSLALVRAVIEAGARLNPAPRIWFVSRNAVSARADDPPTDPATAALWGLGRSAAVEHPGTWGGFLDLGAGPKAFPSADAAALLREILHGDGEDQVALRSGHRFAARLVRMPVPAPPPTAFDRKASYLITGGLGALGIELAKFLVTRRGAKHLILASRRGQKDPHAARARRTLAELGAKVTIAAVDVTNDEDVRRLLGRIAKSRHPLKGVFHCAGLLDDGILVHMDWAKFHRVTAPKIAGAWLLDKLTRDLDLDHFVLFSSILSVIGSAGQANYAAANSFLDALAMRRRSEGLPALALNFGPWAKAGLATASGEKGRAIWRARGTEYITADIGWQAFDALIGSDLSHAAITITEWPVFLQQFATAPALYGDLQKEAGTAPRPAGIGADIATFRSQLEAAPAAELRGLLIAFIRQQAMKTLGLTEPIDPARPLRELGLDSLMAVTLVNRLEAGVGIRVSTMKLVQGPSVDQLADDIIPELTGKERKREFKKQPQKETQPNVTTSAGVDGWLVMVGPKPAPRVRLFCFPFAGGGSAVYRNWPQSLDPAIEVIAIEPPGRLGRIKERPIGDMDEFVDMLVPELHGLLDRPFAFFGHCLGGLTMYETARRLIHTTEFRPFHLFASGARPPDRIDDQGSFEERLMRDLLDLAQFRIDLPPFAQPDDVFTEIIRHFNIRATEQLLEDPELREIMLPVIRAEFKLANNYEYVEEPPWEIPITCFAAHGDPYVSRGHALGWGRFTNSRLQVHMREGAHFAVVDDAEFIHGVINRELLS